MKLIYTENIHPLSIKQLQQNWGWFLAVGISLIALGTLAIMYSFTATIFSVEYLGFLLIVLGVLEGIHSFKINLWSNFFLHLFLSLLYIIGGGFILYDPTTSAINLTLLLAIFFVVSGILKIIFASTQVVANKGWLILNGILTFILGIMIWQQWPFSGLWALGTLLGIDMLFTGWGLIMLAFGAKNLASEL